MKTFLLRITKKHLHILKIGFNDLILLYFFLVIRFAVFCHLGYAVCLKLTLYNILTS